MDLSYKYFSYLLCASLWGAVSSSTEKRATDKWLKGIPQRIRESSGTEMGICTAWVGISGWTREWGGGVLGATLGGQLQMASNTREQFGLHSVDGKEPMQLLEWQNEKTKAVLILVWVPPKAVPKTRIWVWVVWEVITGSTSRGVDKWDREGRKTRKSVLVSSLLLG